MKQKTNHSKQRRLGWVASLFLGRTRGARPTPQQLHQQDFKSSTQKLGVRFSSRLRNAFRRHWLRLK